MAFVHSCIKCSSSQQNMSHPLPWNCCCRCRCMLLLPLLLQCRYCCDVALCVVGFAQHYVHTDITFEYNGIWWCAACRFGKHWSFMSSCVREWAWSLLAQVAVAKQHYGKIWRMPSQNVAKLSRLTSWIQKPCRELRWVVCCREKWRQLWLLVVSAPRSVSCAASVQVSIVIRRY